jgi:glycosyltransferase involved in cell wall biosynthesis
MRIGVDMLGMQTPDHRGRGIGRYCAELSRALFREASAHRFLLYKHDGLPTDGLPEGSNTSTRTLPRDPGGRASTTALARVVDSNPDGLDVLLVLSPFEPCADYRLPDRPVHGLRLAAVVYDLIPLLSPERYLPNDRLRRQFHAALGALRRYDTILTISEWTRLDCLRLLGLPPHQVVTIGTASNPEFFTPEATGPMPASARAALSELGVRTPYVYNVGGEDDRKNVWGLIDGFAGLPARLRQSHQLVVACHYSPNYAAAVRAHAERRGVAGSLVLLHRVTDETLRLLYRHCAVFVFPSLYEGFGLPILEAMHCGAPVIAGRNSSQVEVVGEAGLTFDASDPSELTQRLAEVLDEPSLGGRMRQDSVVQAGRFRWEQTAARAMESLERISGRTIEPARNTVARRQPRPRIAVMSPMAPLRSGISDYTARLIEALSGRYAIDVFRDANYVPFLEIQNNDFGCYDHRIFERLARARNYRAVLYQMGNSHYHRYIYDRLDRWPGLVTLHDFSLVGFHAGWSMEPDAAPDHFRRAFEDYVRLLPDGARPSWEEIATDPRGPYQACVGRMLFLNRKIFDASLGVIVHSRWCQQQAARLYPDLAGRTFTASFGAKPETYDPERKAAIRQQFDIPPEALVLTSIGLISSTKLNAESIVAFAELARRRPDALFLFVGDELDGGETRRTVERLDLARQVRFLGHYPADRLADFGAITDLGVCLRRPPTNGETSAALLDLLRLGVPTIVSDVGSFSDYPDTAVRKVPWTGDDLGPLVRAMIELADHPDIREALGRSALQYIVDSHGWANLASQYEEIIERTYARTRWRLDRGEDLRLGLRSEHAPGRQALHGHLS